jgi:hypothetical protein
VRQRPAPVYRGRPFLCLNSLLKNCCGSHLLRCAVLAPSPIYLICLSCCAPCTSQLAPSRRFSTSC